MPNILKSNSGDTIEFRLRKLRVEADFLQILINHHKVMQQQAIEHLAWKLSAIETYERLASLEARMPRQ